jgi:hypothetical protein
MKKIVAFAFLIWLFNSCTNNINIAQEEEAIKAVIENETNSYLQKDIEQRSKSFLHDESVIVLVSGKRNYGYAVGFKQILKSQKMSVKNNPIASTNKFKNLNYKIKVYEKSAWAVYDEMLYSSSGEFIEKVINARFLEKINGDWKIVYLSHVNTTSYEAITE